MSPNSARPPRLRLPVVHSPLSLLHNPKHEILSGQLQPYFESPERYHIILDALLARAKDGAPSPYEQVPCDWSRDQVGEEWVMDAIRAVHEEEYLEFLRTVYDEWVAEGGSREAVLPETFLRQDLLIEPDPGPSARSGAIEKAGRFSFDLSAPITADTWLAALASCRVGLHAAQLLLAQPSLPGAFALCRPPGHHAAPGLCGGYCFISNAAVAARFLQDGGQSKVAILDIDYHHGNGTSKVFYEDPSVLYVSLHGSPDYPYFTGAATERGAGPGLGANLNLPLPLGTNNEAYLAALVTAAQHIAAWQANVLVVSLGVDTYVDDPLTDFRITLEGYPEMGRVVAELGLQTLFVMEGGYCLDKIGACVRGVMNGFVEGSGVAPQLS